ncbi:MAG: hypothetical protein K6D94_04160 [Clostridiales bacterium]|nr:hypothetical protein [Clostridiales bacterium]
MADDSNLNTAEQRVKKKVQGTYRLKRILFWIGFALFMLIPFALSMIKIGEFRLTFMLWTTPLFVLVDIFIIRQLFRYLDIEYEYSVVSGELRIDIIYGNMRRKEWLRVRFADMSVIAPYEGEYKAKADDPSITARYEAASSLDAPDCYFGTFVGEGDVKSVVFFEPTRKILKQAKLFNAATVVRDVRY